MINLSFTSDLPLLTLPLMKAGAGISAWGGSVAVNHVTGVVSERYPLFHAIRQLMGHLRGVQGIERVPMGEDRVRVYRLRRQGAGLWIAWRDPQGVLLPEDGSPTTRVSLTTGSRAVEVEPVIVRPGQSGGRRRRIAAQAGTVELELTRTPIYVIAVP